MYQRVIWGEIRHEENRLLSDVGGRERAMLIPLMVLMLWMGMYSNHFLRPMDASIAKLIGQLRSRQTQYAGKEFEFRFSDFRLVEKPVDRDVLGSEAEIVDSTAGDSGR
jgi:hypothetical protein